MEYYAQYDFRNSLYHHGVKGQKWGATRTPEQLGRSIGRLEKKNELKIELLQTTISEVSKQQLDSEKAAVDRVLKNEG